MTFARTARPARRLAPGAGAPYFDTLAGYADILRTVSLDDRISGRALGLYRLLGMGLFYAVDYLVRPWRLLVTLRNVFRQQQESRLEMSLRDLVPRHRGFDRLGLQDWQGLRVDEQLDAACDAGLALDQSGPFEREHHLVD